MLDLDRVKLVKQLYAQNNFDALTEVANILNKKDNKNIVVTESYVDRPRYYINGDTVTLLCPKSKEEIITCEGAVAQAIANGTMFDDAETVDNMSKFAVLSTMPCQGMFNKYECKPEALHRAMGPIVADVNDDGRIDCDPSSFKNAFKFVKDLKELDKPMVDIIDNYIGDKSDEDTADSLPINLKKDIDDSDDEAEKIKSLTPEDSITEEQWEYVECDDVVQEGFLSKKPKKLKPLSMNIVSYITTQINDIRDVNDQAMLAGYTGSKLELVDFYITCIDTSDDRFIVPHNRDYLTNMQRQLTALLSKILAIIPVNRNDSVWRVDVNYPNGYQG